jgi:quinol monooxygenase YgiN
VPARRDSAGGRGEAFVRVLSVLLGGVVMMTSALGDARAQAPAPGEASIYAVIYVEVMPTSTAPALAVLKQYREATRKEGGNRRCEVVQRIGELHQLVILEVWKDQAAYEAHGKSASSTDMREKIAAIRNAPTDARMHTALSVGPVESKFTRGAIYVVTHVDVIPPRKDDGVAAIRQLGDESRQHEGNVRFEVVQQTNRANHFTVVEIWTDVKALEAHSMAPATRQFRDKLAPATGALYDERKYTAVD